MSGNTPPVETVITKSDPNPYLQEFKGLYLRWGLIALGLFIFFSDPLQSLLNTIFVQPVFKFCPKDSYLADVATVAFFGYALWFLRKRLKEKMVIAVNSLMFMLTVLLIYLLFFRFNAYFDFYFFHVCLLHKIAYWDLLLIAVLILSATWKSFHQPLQLAASKYSFIDDTPSLSGYADGYSRGAYALRVAEHINKTATESSFAIAVIGEWGSGKTDFLLRIKEELGKDDHNRLIDFNPWRVSKPDAIIEEFFRTLSAAIRPFNHSVTAKIRDYSKRILQTGKEIQYRFFDTVLSEFIGEETLEKQYLAINDSISKTSKRWIIVIDDMDRLTGKEIMEVLRIIRNTANFGNTFFLVAIDQQYIISALKHVKEFANEDQYLKKVFQLTITLPAFKKEIFISQLKGLLITPDISEEEERTITGAIAQISTDFEDVSIPFFPAADHEDIMEKMADNVRDLKRFANSFKIAFGLLKGEVDIHDLMVLELIRNRNIEFYNLIRNRYLLGFNKDRSSEFMLNEEAWTAYEKDQAGIIKPEEFNKLKAAVEYLITDVGYKNSRKFVSSYNFYLYFSYQLFDLISLSEFRALLDKDAVSIAAKFDAWTSEGKEAELLRITGQLTDFPDPDFLTKILVAFLSVKYNHPLWLQLSERLVFGLRNFNDNKYFAGDRKKHQAFLQALMKNNAISYLDRAAIAYLFLNEYIHGKKTDSLILSKLEWQKTSKSLFTEYLSAMKIPQNETLTFLRYNIGQIGTDNKAILYKPSATAYKKAMKENYLVWEEYVTMLLRPAYSPYSGSEPLVMEPFLEQIFGDWTKFKLLLQRSKFTDSDLERIRRIILTHIDGFYKSKREPFKIENIPDSKFVDEWMVDHKITGKLSK